MLFRVDQNSLLLGIVLHISFLSYYWCHIVETFWIQACDIGSYAIKTMMMVAVTFHVHEAQEKDYYIFEKLKLFVVDLKASCPGFNDYTILNKSLFKLNLFLSFSPPFPNSLSLLLLKTSHETYNFPTFPFKFLTKNGLLKQCATRFFDVPYLLCSFLVRKYG